MKMDKHWWIIKERRTACNMDPIDMHQGVLLAKEKKDVTCEKCLGNIMIPNKLTIETMEKTDRGEDLHSFDTVEELMKDLKSE